MNTKIIAILMASIVAMAIAVPMVMGDIATTGANVNDVPSTYDCTGTSITTQPDPATHADGTVSYNLVVTDDNGDDSIPDSTWTAEVDFGLGLQSTTLTADAVNGDLQRTCTGTDSVPAGTAAGDYTVTFKLDTVTVCSTTVTVTSVAAYEIDFDAVNYGTINPGASSTVTGDTTMHLPVGENPPTIENKGNVAMDVEMSIADDVGNPETLFDGNTDATVGTVDPQTLSTTATAFDVNIPVSGTAKIDSTLSVPPGIQAASYSGTLTVTGITG